MKLLVEIELKKNDGPSREPYQVVEAVLEHFKKALIEDAESAYVYVYNPTTERSTEYEITSLAHLVPDDVVVIKDEYKP